MWFTLFYTFLGGLGLFFFGMKMLSEALQSIAGDFIRRIINTLTSNRLVAVGVGALITTIIQSSSVTTVMVVGLVNANLMALSQAIGVILGANIGTTITGWIIAIKVGKFGLLFVGLGIFPHLFSKSAKLRGAGKLLIALGFIFMGLQFMGNGLKPLKDTAGFQDLLVYFSADTYPTLLACIAMGALLTTVIQSSSAMLGVTIALASTGAIEFQTAAALVLGENIGTTITALLASLNTNSHAKRAARAHAVFNFLGVCWMSCVFWAYIQFVDSLIPGVPDFVGADGGKPYVAAHIAASHTIFNVVNTLVFIPLIKPLARFVCWITPAPEIKERASLKFIPAAGGSSPYMALTAAEKEVINLSGMVLTTLDSTKDYVYGRKKDEKLFEQILKHEKIIDKIQKEITVFLCKTQEARLNNEETSRAYSLIRAADELESIADYCETLVKTVNRLDESDEDLLEEEWKVVTDFFDSAMEYFIDMQVRIGTHNWDLDLAYSVNNELTKTANEIRDTHRKKLSDGYGHPIAGIHFADMVIAVRKIKGHVLNMAEALSGKSSSYRQA